MAWCLLLLSQHPTIQQRAREEAQSVAPEGTTITRETLDKLDYITCVAKEVLRYIKDYCFENAKCYFFECESQPRGLMRSN